MVSNLVILTLFAALWQAGYISGQCTTKLKDVMVVIELPNGDSGAAATAKSFVQEMKIKLKPSQQCTKLGFIFVWSKAQPVINMRCNYKGCYRNGLRAIDILARSFRRMTSVIDKRTLHQGIQIATNQLYSPREGAREKAEKVLVLVLNNPPVKGVIATEEELKDYHDMRIKIIAVGVGAGTKENLAEIVVYDHLKLEFDNLRDLVGIGVRRIANAIELGNEAAVQRIGFSGPLGPKGEQGLKGPQGRSEGRRGPPGFAGPIESIANARVEQLKADKKKACTNIVDIAFIIDSSGSVRKHYIDEKYFVQRIASRFEIIEAGSHGGVILFSSHGYIKTVIRFNDFLTTESFNGAIGNLPFYGYMTRIDTALKLAHTELYTSEGKARPNVKKLLFLITDGRQNPDFINNKRLDPAKEAEKLHLSGVQVYAVGIGPKVNQTELNLITRDSSKVYRADDFKELVSDAFVANVSNRLCADAATRSTVKPETITFAKPCNKTSNCGCGCGGCCAQKSPVYINIFKGVNSKNYIMQGAHVSQSGGSNSLGSLGFKEISSMPSKNSTALSSMAPKELASLIQQLMPYQQQLNLGLKELLKRAIAKEGRKR